MAKTVKFEDFLVREFEKLDLPYKKFSQFAQMAIREEILRRKKRESNDNSTP